MINNDIKNRKKRDEIFDTIYGDWDIYLYDEKGWIKYLIEQVKTKKTVSEIFNQINDVIIQRGLEKGYTEIQEELLAIHFSAKIFNSITYYKPIIISTTEEVWTTISNNYQLILQDEDLENELLTTEKTAREKITNYLNTGLLSQKLVQEDVTSMMLQSFTMNINDKIKLTSIPLDIIEE